METGRQVTRLLQVNKRLAMKDDDDLDKNSSSEDGEKWKIKVIRFLIEI